MNRVILAIFFILPFFLRAQTDSIPPVITGLYVNPNPVSPNNDGRNDTTKIGFVLSEPANVTIEVVNTVPAYPVSGTVLFNSFLNSGHFEYAWDGKIAGQIYNATFYLEIFAEDTAGNYSDTTVFSVVVDTTMPLIPYVSVSPNPFSPNNDGVNDYANFQITVDKTHPDEYDTLMLPDARIATLVVTQNSFVLYQNINGHVDTLIVNGNVVGTPSFPPFPVYFAVRADHMTVESFNIGFKDWGSRSVTVTVPGRPPDLVRVGDLTNKMTAASLLSVWAADSLQEPTDEVQIGIYAFTGNLSLNIYDEQGALVNTVNFWESFRGDGGYLYQWGPGPLPDGRYTYDIQLEDEAGNIKHVGGEIIANSVPTTVGNIFTNPPKISPANQDGIFDVTEIRYSISEEAVVNIKLYNSTTRFDSTTYVATLLDNTQQTGGEHSLRFNGMVNNHFLAENSDSTYAIVITAYDPYTGDADQGVGTIEIDNAGPSYIQLDTLAIPHITNSPEDTVVGYTEPASLVKIYKNGILAGQVYADSVSGRFELPVGFEIGDTAIFAIAFDDVMNPGDTSNVLRFIYDPVPPFITGTYPPARSYQSNPIDTLWAVVSDNISGVNKDTFDISLLFNTQSLPEDTSFFSSDTLFLVLQNPILPHSGMDGVYSLVIDVFDSAGNETRDTIDFTFDSESPSVRIEPAGGSIVSRLDTIKIFVIDSLSGVYRDSTSVSLIGPSGNVSGETVFESDTFFYFYPDPPLPRNGVADGHYQLILKVFDQAMNSTVDTFLLTYDTQSPTVDTSIPANGQILANSQLDSIVVVFTDNVSGVNLDVARAALFRDTIPVGGHYVYRYPDTLIFYPQTLKDEPVRKISKPLIFNERFALHLIPPTHKVRGGRIGGRNFRTGSLKDAKSLTDGRYRLEFYVADSAGNSLSDSIRFRIDTSPPALLYAFPSPNTMLRDTLDSLVFYVKDTGCGVESVGVTLTAPDSSVMPGALLNSGDTLFYFMPNSALIPNGAMDGLYRIRLVLMDSIGNTVTDTINFLYDNISPQIIYTRPDSGDTGVVLRDSVFALISDLRPGIDTTSGIDFTRSHIFLLYPDSTAVPGRSSIDNHGDGTYTFSWVIDSSARIYGGTYTLRIILFDRALNYREKVITFDVTAIEPVVISVFPTNGAYVNSVDSVFALIYDRTGSGVDTSTAIQLISPGGQILPGTKSFSGNDTLRYVILHLLQPLNALGVYTLRVTPVSRSGVRGSTFSSSFTFDNQPPVVSSVYPTGEIYTSVPRCWIVFSDFTGLNEHASSIYVTHAGDTLPGNQSFVGDTLFFDLTPPASQEGQYEVRYNLTDLAGNILSDSFSFTISPPVFYATEPAQNDTVRTQLTHVTVYIRPRTGTVSRWSLYLTRGTNDTIPGDSSRLDDTTFTYVLANPLATDGSDNGPYTIHFSVTLDNGLSYNGASGFYYLCDNVPPMRPELTDTLPPRTTSTTITLRGKGEPGARVFVSVNSTLEDSQVVNADSSWIFQSISLTFGQTNFIDIFERDEAGNFSDTLRISIYCGNPVFDVQPSKPFNTLSHEFLISLPQNAKVVLEIYTMDGNRVYRKAMNMQAGNYRPFSWNLKDDEGKSVNNGVYLYVVKVIYPNGKEEVKKGLIAVLR